MLEIIKSASFDAWLSGLKDRTTRARIQARITRLALGNAGDAKRVGFGISELRIHFGPGYRVYYMSRASCVVLLCGGDKSSQPEDIEHAHAIAADWKELKS